ncbi:MAG: hypothetical protein KJ697_04240 [Nanoarchaeota archaeon]|nr:hypothetical protein [Nanoarchaeota archaeon]
MAEEVHIVKDVLIKLVLPILVGVMIITAAYFTWSSLTGISGSENILPSLPASNIPDTMSAADMGLISYSGIQYASEDNEAIFTGLQNYLGQKIMYSDCENCQSCIGDKCDSCTGCQGLKALDFETTFGDCKGCYYDSDLAITNCALCYDQTSESRFCNALKDAIRQNYVLGKEIIILDIARKENVIGSDITIALDQCKNEAIMVTSEDNIEKEICYFDKTSVVTTGFANNPIYQQANDVNTKKVSIPITAASNLQYIGTLVLNVSVRRENINDLIIGGGRPKHDGIFLICKASTEGTCKLSLPLCSEKPEEDCIIDKLDYTLESSYDGYCGGMPCIGTGLDTLDMSFIVIPPEFVVLDKSYIIITPIRQPGVQENFGESFAAHLIRSYKLIFYPLQNAFKYGTCTFDNAIDPVGSIKINTAYSPEKSLFGRFKINLGNLKTTNQRNCEFNLYFCDSSAFANNVEEIVVQIYDFMREFYIGDLRYESNNIVSYNYYAFELDRDYTTAEINEAIEQGFESWISNYLPYYHSSSIPLFNLENNNGIVYDGLGAWEENTLTSCPAITSRSLIETDTIVHAQSKKIISYYCPDGICKNNLKLKVEFTKNALNEIQPHIWFCGD